MEDKQGNIIAKLGDNEYLTCIKWGATIPQKEITKNAAQISKENNSPVSIACKYKDNAVMAVIDGKNKPKKQVASVYLANANGEEYSKNSEKSLVWFCVEPVENNKIWLGSALNGLPFAEDVIVESTEIKDKIEDLLNLLQIQISEEKLITIFVENEDLNLSLSKAFNRNADINFVQKSFEKLIIDTKYQIIVKQQVSLKAMLGMLGIASLIAIGGYQAYEWYNQKIEEEGAVFAESEQERNERERLIKEQKDYEAKKAEILEKTKENIKKTLNEKMTSTSAFNLIQAWSETIGKETLVIPGWDRDEINCAVDDKIRKVYCDYVLTRNKNGTVKSIKDYYANLGVSDIVVDEKGDKAVARIVNDRELDIEQGDYNTVSNFDYEMFKYKTLSSLQRLAFNEISKEVKTPVLYTMNVEIPEAPNGINQPAFTGTLNLGVSEGGLSLKGKEFFKLKALSYNLDKLEKPVLISNLNYKYKTNDWTLNGKYFVEDAKNKGGNLDKINIPKSEIINKGQ